MTSVEYYVNHDSILDAQIGDRTFNIVAGHKKDVIVQQREGKVTIYGWHRLDGTVWQPVSSIHPEDYYDYSHGIRFIYFL